jgi:hypothetical protein
MESFSGPDDVVWEKSPWREKNREQYSILTLDENYLGLTVEWISCVDIVSPPWERVTILGTESGPLQIAQDLLASRGTWNEQVRFDSDTEIT